MKIIMEGLLSNFKALGIGIHIIIMITHDSNKE